MKASELRQLKKEELLAKIRQWKEELFRSRFKTQPTESRDTSIYKKLRKNIARALTVLKEQELKIHLVDSETAGDKNESKKDKKKTGKNKKAVTEKQLSTN